ncbi:T-cell immunoreceptor with Ig and ITIM domains-like isoform X2 [Leucoraja erinacea]|uniref:T-cell immunoreceptor with Ig and ITIM domains-like isoform X2 n=1 Tax=Leucoraja erinaceus TaxID=7782 RepID=UPI0024576496|nr:T-cell immunoreceptor with Ig and ITIM domains-like isoform X2 [Leucoraja erinacea]
MIRAAFVCLLIVSGIQTKEIESSGSVTAVKGSSAALHCASSNKDLKLVLVEWEKSENRTKLVVFNVATNATTPHSERIKLEVNGHRSTITITGVQPADSGWYTCTFHTYPNGKIQGKVHLDVNDNKPTSNLATIIIASVVPVVIVIGILFLLLYFGHRKRRIHTPNQINVLLQNTPDANNQDTARPLSRPIPPNSDGEVPDIDYFSVPLRTSL